MSENPFTTLRTRVLEIVVENGLADAWPTFRQAVQWGKELGGLAVELEEATGGFRIVARMGDQLEDLCPGKIFKTARNPNEANAARVIA